MKKCPKCHKEYDETWKVCIHCGLKLEDTGISSLPPDIAAEFNALKALSNSINLRLDVLEKKIGKATKTKKPALVEENESRKLTEDNKSKVVYTEELPKGGNDTNDKGQSLESKIGGVWFNRIGVIAITLGVGFFLKYAFDNNWIGPLGRVVMGIIAGFAMIISGEYSYKKDYKVFAEGLLAGGVSILYLSIYAAVNFYHLLPVAAGFVFMAVVCLFAGTFAVRFDSSRVLIFSIIGGFLTPFLIFVKGIDPVLLFSYVLLLDLSILGVSYFKKWEFCNLLSLLLTYFTYFAWADMGLKKEYFLLTESFLTGYFILFTCLAVFYNVIRKKLATTADMAVVIFNGILYFISSQFLFSKDYVKVEHMGFLSVILAGVYIAFSFIAFKRTEGKDKNLILSYLSLAVLFATITIPLEFKAHWISIGFFVEAAVLVWLGFNVKSSGLRYTGLVIAAVGLLKLLFVDTSEFGYYNNAQMFQVILNERFLTYLVSVAAALICAYLYRENKTNISKDEQLLATILALSAAVILLINFTLEVDNYFVFLEKIGSDRAVAPYARASSERAVLEHVRELSLSGLWAVYSFCLIVIGMVRKFRPLRLMALVFFVLTIAKVFLFDISSIGRLWRIISFIGLGCVLVGTSFIYQKYKTRVMDFIGKN